MSGDGDHLVFRSDGIPDVARPAAPDGYTFEVWTPSLLRKVPNTAPKRTYEAWWLFHWLHIFQNRDYAVVLARRGAEVAHRQALFPGYFRFPFMDAHDLQIGDVWTAPSHRGKGLAAYGLRFGMERGGGRTYWYLTNISNTASIRTAERAGLTKWGTATRTRRFGLRLLGRFEVA